MEPLISVIIPIFNMEDYLERCLDSIINNTYRNLEVLCVDDGSTDSSAEILRAYAEKDSRIVPIFKENGGVSSARNAGLDRMTGEYVTFVDPDDYVHPQYVELLYRALKESGTEISACAFQEVERNETDFQFILISNGENIFRTLSFSQVFKERMFKSYCCGKMMHSKLVKHVSFRNNMKYGEDTLFYREVCENAAISIMATVHEPLYFYYQRETSLTKIASIPEILLFLKAMVQKLLQPSGRDDIYLDHLLRRGLSLRHLATHIIPDRESARECTRLLKKIRPKVWKTNEYKWPRKVYYLVFIQAPGLYWLYRIIRDPSMWVWEKWERKKRREGKGNAEASAALEE